MHRGGRGIPMEALQECEPTATPHRLCSRPYDMPRWCCQRQSRGQPLLDDDQEAPRSHDERHCTDVACLLLFATTMACLGVVGLAAAELGDPAKIFFATDHLGRRCGIGALDRYPKIYYPQLAHDLLTQQERLTTPWQLELNGICIAACPAWDGEHDRLVPSSVADEGDASFHERWRRDVTDPTVVRRCRLASRQRRAGCFNQMLPTRTHPPSPRSLACSQSLLNRCVPVHEERHRQWTYCASPNCWDARQICATVLPPTHDVADGLWLLTEGSGANSLCARSLDVTFSETTQVPHSGPLLTSVAVRAAAGLELRSYYLLLAPSVRSPLGPVSA